MRRIPPMRILLAAGGSLALGLCIELTPARAQVSTMGGVNGPPLEAPPVATDREDIFVRPNRSEDALIVGDWLAYPSAFTGVVYDTNVSQSTAAKASPGMRLAPALLAESDNDLFKTQLYGNADGRFYFNNIPGNGTIISARAGATEAYSPMRDFVVDAQADFTRQRDLFSTLGADQSVVTLNPTGIGLAPTSNPVSYDQFSGAASVQKNFARAFVTIGGSIVDIAYDQDSAGAVAPSPNGTTYTGRIRGGFWIFPALYAYLEGGADNRDFDASSLNSAGFRTVAGVGTDRIGLMRGEIFAGYQQEDFNSVIVGTVSDPVYGVRGYYYPLPDLTFDVSADQSLGVSLLSSAGTLPGTATKVGTYLMTADYALADAWRALVRAGYISTYYVGSPRRDDAWTVGGTVTYNMYQSLGLTLDYQHMRLSSNAVGASFSRDVVTLGATWRY